VPPVSHLRPTAELAERVLLPDDPGQALALTRVLYDETPRMFNHHRGLWGYTGVAADGAPLTVQSTGIGGPSAAIVVAELAALGMRRAVRIGRAWPLDGAVAAGELVAAEAVLHHGAALAPDADLTAALVADHRGTIASADALGPDPAWQALAYDLESAGVLAAAARAGVRAAVLVAAEGPDGADGPAERLGRAALAAIGPAS
jgi:uridine phosphorylase